MENKRTEQTAEEMRLLSSAVDMAGLSLSNEEQIQFEKYLFEIVEWNKWINLTGIKSPREIILKHFIDSLMVLKFIPIRGSLGDIGTGAGFPGLPIKIKRQDIEMVLFEPRRKRANFIRQVTRCLSLSGVEIYNGRAEDFVREKKFNYVITRALGSFEYFCRIATPLISSGGYIVAMQGARIDLLNESRTMKLFGLEKVSTYEYSLPCKAGERSIGLFLKCST